MVMAVYCLIYNLAVLVKKCTQVDHMAFGNPTKYVPVILHFVFIIVAITKS